MNIPEETSAYHTSWTKIQNQFLFKYGNKMVRVTNNEYNKLNDFNVDSKIRHIINEREKTALILCESHVYRYNYSGGSLSEIKLNLESRTIFSGIVVNGYLLLDTELEEVHQLRVYNINDSANKLIDKKSINLKINM